MKKIRIFLGDEKPANADLRKRTREIEEKSKPFEKISNYA